MPEERVSDLVSRWLKNAPGKSTFTLNRSQLRSLLGEITGQLERPGKTAEGIYRVTKRPKGGGG